MLLSVLLASCNGEPQEVTLSQLAGQQQAYSGRRIQTAGVLRSHPSPLHYWIADEEDNRVELLTGEDLAPSVGKTLQVVGRFEYGAGRGRTIDVERFSERE